MPATPDGVDVAPLRHSPRVALPKLTELPTADSASAAASPFPPTTAAPEPEETPDPLRESGASVLGSIRTEVVELTGALSEPVHLPGASRLSRLALRLRSSPGRSRPRERGELPERQPVLNAVTTVLERRQQPMRGMEILRAVEQLLDRPVSGSSVRNCLSDHVDGEQARFERVSRGRYRARQ